MSAPVLAGGGKPTRARIGYTGSFSIVEDVWTTVLYDWQSYAENVEVSLPSHSIQVNDTGTYRLQMSTFLSEDGTGNRQVGYRFLADGGVIATTPTNDGSSRMNYRADDVGTQHMYSAEVSLTKGQEITAQAFWSNPDGEIFGGITLTYFQLFRIA